MLPKRFESRDFFVVRGLVRRVLHACVWSLIACCAAHAQTGNEAQTTSQASAEIAGRYPANTIDSIARATAALDDVARARLQVAAQLIQDERACREVFFSTRCLDEAHERRRAALIRLQPIEIAANTYKRRARVDERDRALAQKQTAAAPSPNPRAVKPSGEAALPDPLPDEARLQAAKPAGRPAANRPEKVRAATHAQHKATPHQAKSAVPKYGRAEEEANMAAFDRKAAESTRRQHEIAVKKAEKEQERASKKAAAGASVSATP